MCIATKESVWLSRLFADLKVTIEPQPIILGVDRNGAIDIAKNASVNLRNNCIVLQYHFLRRALHSEFIHFRHVPSHSQIADTFARQLDKQLLLKLRNLKESAPLQLRTLSLQAGELKILK